MAHLAQMPSVFIAPAAAHEENAAPVAVIAFLVLLRFGAAARVLAAVVTRESFAPAGVAVLGF